ncbi:MAG: hypothetical protein GX297_09115 [Treponema sp.]|nr:hypothetical protein [Treponema sp.]
MSFNYRLSVCTLMFVCLATFVFAVPGVEPKVDFPGTFVYYRDYTYEDETYIGFLQYDAGTYALRYFSPQAKKGAKSIELYITCDTTKDFVEMTGERIVGEISQVDVETLNYLHDLFYELAARRKALSSAFNESVSSKEEYAQFGGEVFINFVPYIPIFAVQSILSTDKTELFKLVYIGILNKGNEFSDFSGLIVPKEIREQAVVVKKIAKTQKEVLENFCFTLDKQWTKDGVNWWLNTEDNEAVAMISPYFVSFSQDEKYAAEQMKLVSLITQDGSWIDFDSLEITEVKNKTQINAKIMQEDKVIRSISTFYKVTDTDYFVFVFSAEELVFKNNEKYFKKIIDSIKQTAVNPSVRQPKER